MKILIVGGGGREHAMAMKCLESQGVESLYCAPGNGGTAKIAVNLDISADDLDALLDFATKEGIDLCIVGPEAPLVKGIVDKFESAGKLIVGPRAAAAQLEGSKDFSKSFMQRHRIPTAAYRTFTGEDLVDAKRYLDSHSCPIVLKADGLAGGKGVVICESPEEAKETIESMLSGDSFGSAGRRVVVEEFMDGEEVSVFVLTDGLDFIVLSPAQDHKRVGDGDTGPNTGGMGAYAPAPVMTKELMRRVNESIVRPTIEGMREEGNPFKGFLFVGLMVTDEGPKVVEYNCRMGDPETQVVLPLIESDFAEMMLKVAQDKVGELQVRLSDDYVACVVLASKGYPGSYQKGRKISGLDSDLGDQVQVFHAGTNLSENGIYTTSGGRVLAVTGRARQLSGAIDRAYGGISKIEFDGSFYRKDIGKKGLKRLE